MGEDCALLQWGRGLMNAEGIDGVPRIGSTQSLLQWGRGLVNAEGTRPSRCSSWVSCSFNGAAFLRTRKESRRKIFNTSSWNRRLRGLSAFSLGNVPEQDKPSRISLNINARSATE